MKNENKSLSLLSMILTVCAMTVHHSTLMSMPYPYVHYSSTICLSQGQHAVYMCPDCYSTRVWTDFGLGLGLGP